MGIINKLDIQVANLIAAGEVVDRPASVIKELVENSMDAGAKNITVEIKRGGSTLMRVSDDGDGMSPDDVPVCILRHATSKIKNADDLDGITTLGFRGEALAAISSVSHMRIITRRAGDDMGTLMEADSGKVIDLAQTGAQKGTTVIVEELFANVPARRKFLKRDASEAMACSAVVEKLALSHPEVAFKFISDGELRFSTDGSGKLKNAVYSVLGRDFAAKLIPVNSVTEGIEVAGFIGASDNIRANRNYQNYFVNGRYVKSKTVMAAVEQAYNSFIPGDKFPCCVLFVNINPAFVDVNVHPTKLEVKFSDERLIFDAVYSAVRNELVHNQMRPEAVMRTPSASKEDIRLASAFVPVKDRQDSYTEKRHDQSVFFDTSFRNPQEHKTAYPAFRGTSAPVSAPETSSGVPEAAAHVAPVPDPVTKTAEIRPAGNAPEIKQVDYSNVSPSRATDISEPQKKIEYRIVGEVFNSYVIIETGDRVLMIDKHAAHERIIFEQMKRNSMEGRGNAQMLMFPRNIPLSADEYSSLSQYLPSLEGMGYVIEPDVKSHSFDMTGYPGELTEEAAVDMLTVLGEQLSAGTGNADVTREQFYEKALYQASCKAAIKAGHIEDEGHIKWICDNLLALPDIFFCPHGRPVAMEMTMGQIEHQFKRT